jgi:hypothetical protein
LDEKVDEETLPLLLVEEAVEVDEVTEGPVAVRIVCVFGLALGTPMQTA